MIGKDLRSLLDSRGIKYSWLAEKLDVSEASITKWMKGEMPISDERSAEITTIVNNRSLNKVE